LHTRDMLAQKGRDAVQRIAVVKSLT